MVYGGFRRINDTKRYFSIRILTTPQESRIVLQRSMGQYSYLPFSKLSFASFSPLFPVEPLSPYILISTVASVPAPSILEVFTRTRYTGMKNKHVLHDSKVSSQEGIFLSFLLCFFNQKKMANPGLGWWWGNEVEGMVVGSLH